MIEIEVDTRSSKNGPPVKTVKFFDEVRYNLKYDSVASTFSVGLAFDPSNPEHAEFACVSHMHYCKLFYVHENGKKEKILTGVMLSQGFDDSPKSELVQIGGYSKSGAIEDCDIPISISHEYNGLTLKQIIQKILAPFDIGLKITGGAAKEANTKFTLEEKVDRKIPKSSANVGKNIKSYFTELATQRNLVLSNDQDGDLLLTVANPGGSPILDIDADLNPLVGYKKMRMVYNGQPLHTHITVVRQTDINEGNAAEFTIENPFIAGHIYRPRTISLTSGDDITIEEAGRNELGKELKSINLVIEMDRLAVNNKLIRPNMTVRVRNRKLFLYKPTEWLIESVDGADNTKEQSCVLNCVPIFAYNNKTPINFFVSPHDDLPRV